MRTVDITIEDASFAELDRVSRAAGLTPVEFIRRATAAAVHAHKTRDAARRDASGYTQNPVTDEEFAIAPEDLAGSGNETW